MSVSRTARALTGEDTDRLIPYGRQWVNADDVAAVAEALRSDWLTQGPRVEEFEARIAEYCGARYGAAFSSGTAALHAAVFAAGIGPGDDVITSPLSFAASAHCVAYQGAIPRFVDVEPNGVHLDARELAARMTPRTKAIIPVDYAGHPADLDGINAVARERGVVVIEDAAHSLGAEYRGKRIGTQSDLTILSFHPVKLITTAEGGMVLTNRREYYERLVRFRTHGIVRQHATPGDATPPWSYEVKDLGYNYRLSDVHCALGLSQLKKIDLFLKRRQEIAAAYDKAFEGLEGLHPVAQKPHVTSSYHLYVVLIDFERLGKGRSEVMRELRRQGIGSQVHYIPIHLHPYYREQFGYQPGQFPHAERFYTQALSLPIYPKMSDADVRQVIEAVHDVMEPARCR